MAIVPGITAYNPYDLFFMPYTHGLVGALAWSILAALLAAAVLRRRRAPTALTTALILGACVFSHWLLDVPMHTADMPLAGDHSPKIGLGLWHHRNLSLAAELAALYAGVAIWLRAEGGFARSRAITIFFLVVLTAILLATPFMSPPRSPAAFAITALVSYVALALFAAWVDRRRSAHPSNRFP
jgi:hypothetical protein